MAKRTPKSGSKPVSAGNSPVFLTEQWPIDRPTDYPKNARKWSSKAVDKVAQSLREFGFRQPIVVDKAGVIVIGHLRRAAARVAGFTEVPVHVAADLSPARIRALRLMDNRSHDEAEWDLDILADEMKELAAMDLDLSLTGFDDFLWPIGEGITPEWAGMPECDGEDLTAWQTIKIHFANVEDRDAFVTIIGQPITDKTRFLWHPKAETRHYVHMRDYKPFKNNKFIPKPGFVAPTEDDNYGMELVEL